MAFSGPHLILCTPRPLRVSAAREARSRFLRLKPLLLVTLGLLGLAACDDYPRDPNRTLERVLASDVMQVVVVDHEPWAKAGQGQAPTGAEVKMVQAFAQDLGVEIEWHRAPTIEAMEALERGDADLAIGGFTAAAVEAHPGGAPTYAYFIEKLVVAAEPGAPVPQDIDGERVLVPAELLVESLVEDRGGVPVVDPGEGARLVVLPQWQIPGSGLVPTPVELRREEHVLAVPPGENAWLMRLERFLRDHAGDVGERLREHAT